MHQFSLTKEKIRAWPADWDIHVLNTFDLYFDQSCESGIMFIKGNSSFSSSIRLGKGQPDPSYEDMRQNILISSIQLEAALVYKDQPYLACFGYRGCGIILGMVMKIRDVQEDENGEYRLVLTHPIEAYISHNAYECAKKIEKIIVNDHDNDDDNDDDGPELPTPDPVTDLYKSLST